MATPQQQQPGRGRGGGRRGGKEGGRGGGKGGGSGGGGGGTGGASGGAGGAKKQAESATATAAAGGSGGGGGQKTKPLGTGAAATGPGVADKKNDTSAAKKNDGVSGAGDAASKRQRGGQVGGGGGGGGNKSKGKNKNDNKNKGDKGDKDHNAPKKNKKQNGAATSDDTRKQEEARKRKEKEEEARILEQKRKEEEDAKARAAAEAAAYRRKKGDELTAKAKDMREILKGFVDVGERHKMSRLALAPEILAKSRDEFQSVKKNLKTDLKKCTAFVKKVKSGTAWAMKQEDLTKDIATLNLTRYVEEVAGAVLESKPKVTDIPLVVVLCTEMHTRYEDFLATLLPGLWDVVLKAKADVEVAKLRRIYVRLLTDFLLSGLLTETRAIIRCVSEATGASTKDDGYTVQDGNMVVAFCRAAGFEVFGIIPKSVKEAASWFKSLNKQAQSASDDTIENLILPDREILAEGYALSIQVDKLSPERAVEPDISQVLTQHCLGAYDFMAKSLVQTHAKLQKLEKRCEQDRLLSGSLTDAREQGLADARKLKENLQKSVDIMSDTLDQVVPVLEEDEDDGGQGGGLGVEVWTKGGNEEDNFGPFDDEETRDFYCDIPDLLATIPPALLGMTPEQVEKKKEENQRKYGKNFEAETYEGDDAPEVAPASEAELDADENDVDLQHSATESNEENANEGGKDTPHFKLMVLLEEELPECHRREQIDEVTDKFCTNHGSSKNSRKRLSRALFLLPRNRFDLLPYYSRMAATVDRVWSDICTPLVSELEQQFHGQAKYKKNQNPDARIKTARYIGELTKFRVAPPIVFIRCLRRCLDDFTGSNVDVACCLLESCGRFLYRLKHTNKKISDLMETMTRLSKAKNLDDRSQALIKGAFYTVKPPPSGPRKQAKEYPPLETYMRRLLIERLVPTSSFVSFVAKQIIRLPWNDPSQDCGALISKIMMKACRKGRYSTIEAIALVAARLRGQRVAGEVSIRLIDDVLEELRWALEQPNFRDQQRVLTYARLLGELYVSNLVSGQLIIRQLYDFINLGHEITEKLREASKQLVAKTGNSASKTSNEQLPVYNSATGISQTIKEDEEMEGADLETKEEESGPQPVAVSEHSKYDPRVPSLTDPPNSAYRIKLVCTLLEVVAKSIVTRNNVPRLQGFLAAFQRYLFTKSMMPTDVEFALLDTFDVLDSQWRQVAKAKKQQETEESFPRYATWLESHNATVAVEESEAMLRAQGVERLESAIEETKSLGTDMQSVNEDEDDEEDEEDILSNSGDEDSGSSDSTSEAESASEGIEEEVDVDVEAEAENSDQSAMSEGDEGEETDSSESYSDDEEEFDEEAYMRQLEEEAFERELRRMTMDAIEKGKTSSRKQVADYMPVGSQIVKKKTSEGVVPEQSTVIAPQPFIALGGKAGVSFQMLKRGTKGKVEAKEIVVPSDTNLALAASKQDDEAARERDVIKQRVLQYEADSAYADEAGGNVYLEQEKLQVIRNRPLSIEEIDKNFGTTGGTLLPGQSAAESKAKQNQVVASQSAGRGRGRGHIGGGRGRGRVNTGGRTLFR